jgi:hypothetical protein
VRPIVSAGERRWFSELFTKHGQRGEEMIALAGITRGQALHLRGMFGGDAEPTEHAWQWQCDGPQAATLLALVPA